MRSTSLSLMLVLCVASVLAACAPQAAAVPSDTPTATATQQPSATPAPTQAPETVQDMLERCPRPDEMAAIDADLKLTFEHDPSPRTSACRTADGSADLSLLQLRTYQVLLVMKVLRFSQPLPWTDLPLYGWLTSVIDGITFGQYEDSHCCNPPGTINLQSNSQAMYTSRWMREDWYGSGAQGLMMIIIHEARHATGIGHSCPAASLAGGDYTINELGAWGVMYYTHVWLANYSDPAFFTPGGAQPDLYRELNRDKAVDFMEYDAQGGYEFCGQPTRTPGPTPTIPPSASAQPAWKVIRPSDQPIETQGLTLVISYNGVVDAGFNPLGLRSNKAMQFVVQESSGKQADLSELGILITDGQGRWVETSFAMGKTPTGGQIYNIFAYDAAGEYYLKLPDGVLVDLSGLVE